jgi:hypothetical protein
LTQARRGGSADIYDYFAGEFEDSGDWADITVYWGAAAREIG